MAVDYEEGRRLLAVRNDAQEIFGDSPKDEAMLIVARAEMAFDNWLHANAEALLNPDPWRPIDELPEELHGKKIIVCWEASGGWDDHWEIGVKKQRGWVNNYGHPFTGEPTHFREIKGPGQ